MPSSASPAEIQKFSEWFGALGRVDHRRLKKVGCRLEIFSHNDVSPFKPSVFKLKITNNTQMALSWRVMQRCRLSNECFVTVSPSKGIIDRNATSAAISVYVVLFHAFTLKHMIYFECSWGSTGTTFYLPIGLNVKPGASDPSLTYWRVKIPAVDQLSVISPRQGGSVLLCTLCGVEVVMKTWMIGSKDPVPPQFEMQLSSFLSLSHPNLVRFIGAHLEPGEVSIVVEYVLNGSLNDFLTRAEPSITSSMPVRCNIALDISRALAYLHSKGKVHSSLVGRSILIDEDLHAKLSGFSSIVDAVEEAVDNANPTASSASTTPFSSPNTKTIRTKSNNCYQFGLFLWELLTGLPSSSISEVISSLFSKSSSQSSSSTPPPSASNSPIIPHHIILESMPFLNQRLLSTYPDYLQIMMKCLDPVPSRRPTIIEIVGELTTICDTPQPRTLSHLNLSTNTSLQDQHLASLPSELISLDLACNNNISTSCAPYLPSTLQTLTLGNPNVISQLAEIQILSLKPTPIASLAAMRQQQPQHGTGTASSVLGPNTSTSSSSPSSPEETDPSSSSPSSSDSDATASESSSSTFPAETEIVLPKWICQNLTLKCLSHLNQFEASRMSILYAPHLTDEHVALLPKSLTFLELGNSNSITNIGISLLPPNLKTLIVSSCLLSFESAKSFPSTLTELVLPKTTQLLSDLPLPPHLTSLTLGDTSLYSDMLCLPRGITKLDLGRNLNLCDADIAKLPRFLVWFSLQDNHLLTSQSIPFLPSTLQHLRITGNAKFGEVIISSGSGENVCWPKGLLSLELPDNTSLSGGLSLQYLPPGLTRLQLLANQNISNEWVPQLPRTLTLMEISEEPLLTEACLPFLPPTLLTLNVVIPSTYVKELPRRLTALNVERCHTLVDNCLSDLPVGLLFLKISCGRITDSGILFLPQQLHTLHLINNVYLTDNGIKDLPSGLTKLVIEDGDTLTAGCVKNLPRGITHLVLPPTVMFDITDESVRDLPRYITELNMERNENLTNAGIIRLPRTLTSLNLSNNENLTDSCVKHLPRGLIYLNVSMSDYLSPACLSSLPQCQLIVLPNHLMQNIRDRHIEFLPRHLLSWDMESNKEVSEASFEMLPHSLTKLGLPKKMVIGLDDDHAKYLPPVLTELDLSLNTTLTDKAIRFIPLSLTRLNLYWNTNLTDSAISLLPRGILCLNLGCSDKLTDMCAPHFPRRLLELSIDANSNFTDAFIAGLPSSIVYLNLSHAFKLTHACLAKMPPLLTAWEMSPNFLNSVPASAVVQFPRSLKKLNMWGNFLITDNSLTSLPPQLTYLNISSATSVSNYAIPFLPATLKTLIMEDNKLLEDSSVSYMPRGITHLNLASSTKLSENTGNYFPPGLLFLDMSNNSLINDSWIQTLPRSIQHLSVQSARLTADCLPNLPPNLTAFDMPPSLIVAIGTENATLLPKSLTFLNLWCNTAITNVGIKSLPRVTSLNLAHNNIISDSGVCLFPQHLTSLIMSSNTKLTNGCLRELPRSLTELNLASAPITDDGIRSLPRALRKLSIIKAKVTDACVPDLPQNLIQLSATGLSKDLLRRHLVHLKFTDS